MVLITGKKPWINFVNMKGVTCILATEKLAAKVKGVGIDAQLDAQLRNDQEHHGKMLMKLL